MVSFESPKFKFQVRILASPPMRIFKTKKLKFFLTLPIALISLNTYLGSVLGYLTFRFFTGKIPSLAFNIGDYRLHLHHWLLSLAILLSAWHYNFLPFPQFSFGFLSGAIFEGIYCYRDWYRIIFKHKKNG